MSLQIIKKVFENLNSCSAWSVQLLNGRLIRDEFVYNAHDITITTGCDPEFYPGIIGYVHEGKGKTERIQYGL